MNIYNIEIPKQLITPTIKKTNWLDIEPLMSKKDINAKWVGNRNSQIPQPRIDALFLEDEHELKKSLNYFIRQTRENIQEFQKAYRLRKDQVAWCRNDLLSMLRSIYIIKSLLMIDDYERQNKRSLIKAI